MIVFSLSLNIFLAPVFKYVSALIRFISVNIWYSSHYLATFIPSSNLNFMISISKFCRIPCQWATMSNKDRFVKMAALFPTLQSFSYAVLIAKYIEYISTICQPPYNPSD